MTRLVRVVATAAGLLGPLLLVACGIKPTGVIGSGAPATVVISSPDHAGFVYFVTPDGRLVPSPQVDSPPSSATGTLLRLLAGPGPQERAAGLGTRLPEPAGREIGAVAVTLTGPEAVEVRIPFSPSDLSDLARSQLVCTVTSATVGENRTMHVLLTGPESAFVGLTCDQGR